MNCAYAYSHHHHHAVSLDTQKGYAADSSTYSYAQILLSTFSLCASFSIVCFLQMTIFVFICIYKI